MSADAGFARIDIAPAAPPQPPMPAAEAGMPLRLILTLEASHEPGLRRVLGEIVGTLPRTTARRVERVYWDTAEGALGRSGFALGLRHSGAKHWQRMLAIGRRRMGGGGVQDIEAPITGDKPDLVRLALQPGADARAIGAVDAEALLPLFAVDAKRLTWRIEWHGAKLSVSFETGILRSPSGDQPFGHLILDSESGPAMVPYDLARALWQSLPLDLAEFDAVQEGYRLACKADWWRDATKPKLTAEMTTREGILAIGGAALAAMRGEMAPFTAAPAPERVHQARVAIRRLRSLLTVFGPALPEEARRGFAKSLGNLANALGETREWDVFLADAVAPIAQALPEEASLTGLRLSAAVLREQAAASLDAHIAKLDYKIQSLMLGAWFDAGIWPVGATGITAEAQFHLDQPLGDFARDILRKRHRRMVNTAEALNDPRPAELHDLRLHAKKLRYTAEFFAALYPAKAAKPYIAALRDVQEVLGHINDAAVTPALLARLKSTRSDSLYTTGLVTGWTAAHAERARARFADAWKELKKAKRFWKEE